MSKSTAAPHRAKVPFVTIASRGRCLVIGGSAAVDAARSLAADLSVTLVLTERVAPPPIAHICGSICSASGGFGAFAVTVQSAAKGSTRQAIKADIVVDLTGGRSLFSGCGNRDGYVRARPTDAATIGEAVAAARELVGEFEKPLHVSFEPSLCAHARNGITGCTRCLAVCPAGAIIPAGDRINVDAAICEGCGSCAGGCPTGALSATMPPSAELFESCRAATSAGGQAPILLFHEAGDGADLADAVQVASSDLLRTVGTSSILQIGHDVLLGALASGARAVVVLVPRRHGDHLGGLEAQVGLATTIVDGLGHGEERILLLTETDPELIVERLAGLPPLAPIDAQAFGRIGSKREVTASILAGLHACAPSPVAEIALPRGAPYGAVILDDSRCTLCLACVAACPVQAMQDRHDSPELKFDEAACVQCGLCAATCPEEALTLMPRLDFGAVRGRPRTLKAEAPFACRACGKPFGTRSAIERVKRRLAGNPHFASPGRIDLIEMCADCRVRRFLSEREPMAGSERPRVTTSEDYMLAPDKLPEV